MKTTKITTAMILALSFLFGATAWAGDFDPILDADIINNQMVGMEPVGRTLTAEELDFGPLLDADFRDPAMEHSTAGTRVLADSELVFDWIFDDAPICEFAPVADKGAAMARSR